MERRRTRGPGLPLGAVTVELSDPTSGPRRRIAFVITRSDAVGGAQVHVLELAAALREAGHVVKVFLGGAGPFLDRLRAASIPFDVLPNMVRRIDPRRDLPALLELVVRLRAFRPDLVTTHSSKAGWLGRAAARWLGVPAVFTAHGWLVSSGRLAPLRRAVVAAERVASMLVEYIIVVSDSDRRLAVEHAMAPPRKLHVVHNALPDVPASLRADPKREPARIVMVARLAPPKDPFSLLKALAQLQDLPWTLELIGDGPQRPQLEAAVREHGLTERVELLGTRTDVPERLAGAQIFVLCSRREGFPISVLEAMRAGLPVVSTDVGGIAEAVQSGVTGTLVPRNDADALRRAVRDLLVDPSLRARWGAAGRRRYETLFTFERHVQRTWAVYVAAMARRAST